MTLTEAVAAVLRGARHEAGLTQDQVQAATGIVPVVLNRIERAKRDINVARLGTLAELYGLTPHEVMTRAEERLRRGVVVDGELPASRPLPPPVDPETDTESSG